MRQICQGAQIISELALSQRRETEALTHTRRQPGCKASLHVKKLKLQNKLRSVELTDEVLVTVSYCIDYKYHGVLEKLQEITGAVSPFILLTFLTHWCFHISSSYVDSTSSARVTSVNNHHNQNPLRCHLELCQMQLVVPFPPRNATFYRQEMKRQTVALLDVTKYLLSLRRQEWWWVESSGRWHK